MWHLDKGENNEKDFEHSSLFEHFDNASRMR